MLMSIDVNKQVIWLSVRLLYKRSHVTTLALDNNFITSVGLDNVTGILSYNRSLTHLHLRNNWLLTDRSVLLALQILDENTHICTFDFLESIHGNTKDTHHFTTLLRRNRNMRHYYDAAKDLATNTDETIPSALWPRILCNLRCPDDMYALFSEVIVSKI